MAIDFQPIQSDSGSTATAQSPSNGIDFQPIDKGIDFQSIGTAPKKDLASQVIDNYGDAFNDLGNVAGGIAKAVTHPYDTAVSIGNAALHPWDTAKAIGSDIANKYGSPEKAMDTAIHKPFTTMMDASIAAGGAGEALKAVGGASDIATASKAGEALSGAANVPVDAAGKIATGAVDALKGLPDSMRDASGRLYNWMVKSPASAYRYGKDPAAIMAKEKVTGNSITDLADNFQDRLDQRNQELQSAVQGSDKTIDASKIINTHLDTGASQAEGSLQDRTGILNKLQYMKDKIESQYGDLSNLSVQDAIKLKRQLADDFPFSGDPEGNIMAKTAHKMYHDINDAVETAHPEIKDLNDSVSSLIDISKAAKNRVAVESRSNPLGLIQNMLGMTVGGEVGHMAGGLEGAAVGVGTALAAKAATSPAILSRVAKTLSNMADIDKINLFKAAPWFMDVAQKAHEFVSQGGMSLGMAGKSGSSTIEEAPQAGAKAGQLLDNPTMAEDTTKALPAPEGNYSPTGRTGVNPEQNIPGLPSLGNAGDKRVVTTPVQEGQSIKALPAPDKIYGDNFTANKTPGVATSKLSDEEKSQMIKKTKGTTQEDKGKSVDDITNDPEVMANEKDKFRSQMQSYRDTINKIDSFNKDIKGKFALSERKRGDLEEIRNQKELFSSKGRKADEAITEIYNKYPEFFDVGREDVRGEHIMNALDMSKKMRSNVTNSIEKLKASQKGK